jgi:putative ABC transport system permease protein
MSQAVEQRTREIGVRLALRASRRNVFALVMGRAAGIVLAGIAAGGVMSLGSMPLLDPLLYQVRATDFPMLAGCGVVLLIASLTPSYLPVRRATRVDPLASLRAE